MKKTLLILSLFATAKLFGQAIPNAGFESWNSTPYSNPASWYTSNPQCIIAIGVNNVTQVTGFSGNAVHLQTTVSAGDTEFAYVTNTAGDISAAIGGVPYTQKSTGLSGYCRYNLPGNDTAIIIVIFKKSGSVIGMYLDKIRGTGSLATFTSFNFTFTPALSVTPDTMIIGAASSNVFTGVGIQNASWLELDQLAFTGPNTAIAGGDFDTWNSLSFDKPVGWSISNGGPMGTGVAKTSTHYSGSYAISLTTQSGGKSNSINAAMISNGKQARNGGPYGGQPYTNTAKDTLFGYYQYSSPGNDSAVVSVQLTQNGSMVGGTGMQLKKAATWTPFKLGFQSFSTPDSILISFTSSVWSVNGTIGSVLLVDNIYLQSEPLAVVNPNVESPQAMAYPNPASTALYIPVKNVTGSVTIHVYDITGRIVKEEIFTSTSNIVRMNITDLHTGMYFYKLDGANGNVLNKFIKE